MPGPRNPLSFGAHTGSDEVVEYMETINGGDDEALSWQRRRRSVDSDEMKAQGNFMKTANKCLEKLKLPAMDLSQASDWNSVQVKMEQACAALEKVSTRDSDLSGVRGKMKKAFRGLCKNAGAGKIFTSLIPDDVGGSVLCGGLNVIFTALEQTGFHREGVYRALERLPRILNNHVEYAELASEDAEIHRRTAKLYTEVLLTLEHILRWFMMDAFVAGAKRLLNPSAFTTNLNDRVAEVNLAAKDLKARGTQIMWRQMKEMSSTQKWMAYENVKMGRQLGGIDQNVRLLAERSDLYEGIEAAVRDNLQPLLQGVMQRLLINNTMAQVQAPALPAITSDEVLRELEYDSSLVTKDIRALLRLSLPTSITQLDINRVRALQRSPRVRSWLAVDEESLLLVNGGGTDPLDESISFTNAKMVGPLLEQTSNSKEAMTIIPLAYFCSQHRNYYRDVSATPTRLAMSLLLQLIDHFPDFQPADLQQCLDETESDDIASIFSSFGRLVRQLPTSAVVFLVVDGVSFFSTPPGRMKGMREVVQYLVDIYRQQPAATLKILLSSGTRTKFLEDLFEEDEILNLPSTPAPVGGPSLFGL